MLLFPSKYFVLSDAKCSKSLIKQLNTIENIIKNKNKYLKIFEFNSDLIENLAPPITLYD